MQQRTLRLAPPSGGSFGEEESRLAVRLSGVEGGAVVERALGRALWRVAHEIPCAAGAIDPFLTGGKCRRARVVLLASAALGHPPPARAIRLATEIELIHAGALCHDDVVDRSDTRRDRPTMRAMLGNRGAVEIGLFLLLRGATLLAIEPIAVRTAVAYAVRRIVHGQIDELADLFVGAQTPADYLERARAKTGALYGLAARLGAFAGALPTPVGDAVASFGSELGLGFQLADDVQDLIGGPALGREAGTDLREGVYTLPVLLTLAGHYAGGHEVRRLLALPWTAQTVRACVTLLRRNGAIDATTAAAHAAIARGILALRACPETDAVAQLVALARAVLPGPAPPEPRAIDVGDRDRWRPASPLPAKILRVEHRRWLEAARGAPRYDEGLGNVLLTLAGDVGESRSEVVRVGLIDLLVSDVFALLPRLRTAEAVWMANGLAQRVRERIGSVGRRWG